MFHGASICRLESLALLRTFGAPTVGGSTGRVMIGTCSPASRRLPTIPSPVHNQPVRIRRPSMQTHSPSPYPRSYSTSVTALMSKRSKGESARATLEEQVVDLINAELHESSEIMEVLHAFLSQTGFELKTEGEHVALRKEAEGKSVLVSFAMYEDVVEEGDLDGDDVSNEPQSLSLQGRWDAKDHGMEIPCYVTLSSPDKVGITLECAVGPSKGGEFYVESISSGNGSHNMMFAALSDALQTKIYEYLSSFGVNDNLAKFILHYVRNQDTNSTYNALDGMRCFLSSKKGS